MDWEGSFRGSDTPLTLTSLSFGKTGFRATGVVSIAGLTCWQVQAVLEVITDSVNSLETLLELSTTDILSKHALFIYSTPKNPWSTKTLGTFRNLSHCFDNLLLTSGEGIRNHGDGTCRSLNYTHIKEPLRKSYWLSRRLLYYNFYEAPQTTKMQGELNYL